MGHVGDAVGYRLSAGRQRSKRYAPKQIIYLNLARWNHWFARKKASKKVLTLREKYDRFINSRLSDYIQKFHINRVPSWQVLWHSNSNYSAPLYYVNAVVEICRSFFSSLKRIIKRRRKKVIPFFSHCWLKLKPNGNLRLGVYTLNRHARRLETLHDRIKTNYGFVPKTLGYGYRPMFQGLKPWVRSLMPEPYNELYSEYQSELNRDVAPYLEELKSKAFSLAKAEVFSLRRVEQALRERITGVIKRKFLDKKVKYARKFLPLIRTYIEARKSYLDRALAEYFSQRGIGVRASAILPTEITGAPQKEYVAANNAVFSKLSKSGSVLVASYVSKVAKDIERAESYIIKRARKSLRRLSKRVLTNVSRLPLPDVYETWLDEIADNMPQHFHILMRQYAQKHSLARRYLLRLGKNARLRLSDVPLTEAEKLYRSNRAEYNKQYAEDVAEAKLLAKNIRRNQLWQLKQKQEKERMLKAAKERHERRRAMEIATGKPRWMGSHFDRKKKRLEQEKKAAEAAANAKKTPPATGKDKQGKKNGY